MILLFQAIRLAAWSLGTMMSLTCHSSIINLPGKCLHMSCFLQSIYHPVLLFKLLLLSVLSAIFLLQMVSQQREPSPLPLSSGNSGFSAESRLVCSLAHELICQLSLAHTNAPLLSIFAAARAPLLQRLNWL